MDQLHALFEHSRVVGLCSVGNGAFHIVYHWQYGCDSLLAAVEYEFSLLLQSAFAVVVKLSHRAEIFVFQFLYLSVSLLQRVFLLFFGSHILVGFLVFCVSLIAGNSLRV